MDDLERKQSPARKPTLNPAWTPRFLLWAIACAVGLWLGTATRTVAAGEQRNKAPSVARTALADVFRFDILLAGKEPSAKLNRPLDVPEAAGPDARWNLPAAVLVARQQRPEPIPSAVPKTLSCPRSNFRMVSHARPEGLWSVKLNENLAHLELAEKMELAEKVLHETLAMIPRVRAAEGRLFQSEARQACAQIKPPRLEQFFNIPATTAPHAQIFPADLTDAWPERGIQLVP